jgi:hypothetical protein
MPISSTHEIDVRSRIASIAPAVAALFYPVALHALYGGGRLIRDATSMESTLSAWTVTLCAAALVYSVPAIAVWAIRVLGQEQHPTPADIRARGLAHLAFASPPLFTALGVTLFLVHSSSDHIAWALIWLPIVVQPRTQKMQFRSLRTGHGLSAIAILALFLALHLANHLAAIWSTDLHKAVMDVLRSIYRQSVVQSILVGLLFFQIVSGVVLLRRRIDAADDTLGSLQTASGAYLGAFIASHLMAVFVLGRQVLHVDTNWDFAVGAPAGLIGDPWNVRLIPHYSLAVFLLCTHIACGLRAVLLGRHATLRAANRTSGAVMAAGAMIALTITLAMLGLHVKAELSPAALHVLDRTGFAPETASSNRNERTQSVTKMHENQRNWPLLSRS